MAHSIMRDEVVLALQMGSTVAAAMELGIPASTLREMCYRWGISSNGEYVIADRAMKFRAGSYQNRCDTLYCAGFPLHSGYCIKCTAKHRRKKSAIR